MTKIMSSSYVSLFDADGAADLRLAQGAPLFFAGDPVTQIALVREGAIHLLRRTSTGTTVILQAARPGDVVAEASAYSPAYHCGAEAACASRVTLLPIKRFRAALAANPAAAEGWAAHLARTVQRPACALRSAPCARLPSGWMPGWAKGRPCRARVIGKTSPPNSA